MNSPTTLKYIVGNSHGDYIYDNQLLIIECVMCIFKYFLSVRLCIASQHYQKIPMRIFVKQALVRTTLLVKGSFTN